MGVGAFSPLPRNMGGVQNVQKVWGEETYRRTHPPKNFWTPRKKTSGLLCCGFLYRENRLPGGVPGKRAARGGVPNPFLEVCPSQGFPPPSFFHPPHLASSEKTGVSEGVSHGCPRPFGRWAPVCPLSVPRVSQNSRPNMTGRRFPRTMEMILALPW